MCAEVRVVVDAGGNLGMRQLHQQRASTSQQEDVLAVYAPRDRMLLEQPGPQAVAFAISALNPSTNGL